MPDKVIARRQELKKVFFDRNITKVSMYFTGMAGDLYLDDTAFFSGVVQVYDKAERNITAPSSANRTWFEPIPNWIYEILEEFACQYVVKSLLPDIDTEYGGVASLEWDIFNDIIKAEGNYHEVTLGELHEAVF